MNIEDTINKDNLPKHLAIIMDGNGRWAKQKGLTNFFGEKIKEINHYYCFRHTTTELFSFFNNYIL